MNVKYTFRHMENTPVLEEHSKKQLARIIDFLQNERSPVFIELTCEPGKVHAHHKVHLLISSPDYNLFNDYEGPDFYEVLDRVTDIMYRNLLELKDKHIEDRKMTGRHEEFKKQR
jgi:ribosomal subunit interface protein